jgi:Sulfotransferase family
MRKEVKSTRRSCRSYMTTGQESQVEQHRFVFIGGLHRSGTSVVFRCLREHPRISGFANTGVDEDEGQHLQSVYPTALTHGGPGRFGFHPDAHLTETSDLVSEDNRLRLFAEWERYWDLERPVLLEKSPPNLIRTRFLQELFPNSYFVIVVRHPVAVAYATQKWSNTSLPQLIEHWLVCHERFEQDRQHIRRLLVLKYEDFVEKPQAALDEIYSFLGLPSSLYQLEVRLNVNEEYLKQWREYQSDTLSGGCIEAAMVKLQYEKRIAAFGYSLDGESPVAELVGGQPDLSKETTK